MKIKYNGSLQFITHRTERYDEINGAQLALEGGCRWIQLRMKGAEKSQVLRTGKRLRELCDQYGATLIVDDWVDLVKEIKADGVHLGLSDMAIDKARQMLGQEYLIGATANTPEQAIRQSKLSADYIGCGPFRFTETKKNLAPVLGLDGYRTILNSLEKEHIYTPLVAIGGIELRDISALIDCGVDGVALSGSILRAEDPKKEVESIIQILNNSL